MSDKTIIGVGQLAIDGRVIENPTTFEIAVEYEDIVLKNTGTTGGGEYAKKSRISTIGFTATVHDFSAATLARLLSGDASSVASSVVSDESMTSSIGKLVTTALVIDTGTSPVVTSDPAGTTYTEGTDYVVTAAGIRTLSTGTIPDATALLVSYTSYATGKVEMATTIADDVAVIFDGWNDEENVPVIGEFYKVSLKGDGVVALISEEYGAATISGSMLQDTTKTGAISKYGKLSVGGVPVL